MGTDIYKANIYVSNLYLTYGNNKTSILKNISYINDFQTDFKIQPGEAVDLSLYGDINSSVPKGSTINSSILVSGLSSNSNTVVNTNSNTAFAGQSTFFSTGSLSVASDSSDVSAKISVANQKIFAGKFLFSSSADSYNISELKFIIPNSNNISAILNVILTDTDSQKIISTVSGKNNYNGGDLMFDFNVNIPINLNSAKSLSVSYVLDAKNSYGAANVNLAPVLIYIKALNNNGDIVDGKSANYTNIISNYGGINLPDRGVTVPEIYIFKSIPVITADALSYVAPNNSNLNLYNFNIAANPAGDISIKQITFDVTINDFNGVFPHLNRFSLLKDGKDYTYAATIGNVVNNNYISLTSDGGIGVGTNPVTVTFNTEENISAGTNHTYILKAIINNFSPPSSVVTNLSPDLSA
jgi:hypothetical protein